MFDTWRRQKLREEVGCPRDQAMMPQPCQDKGASPLAELGGWFGGLSSNLLSRRAYISFWRHWECWWLFAAGSGEMGSHR